jgi:hypothetical protein
VKIRAESLILLNRLSAILGLQLTQGCSQHRVMKATWRFRAVRHDLTGFSIRRMGGSGELLGTDEEALAFSLRVRAYFCSQCLRRVEARSIGQLDLSVPDAGCRRKLARLRPHENGMDWITDPLPLHHPAWHRSLEDAINYAAFRLRGYVSEIRIFDRRNELQTLVLIDQTGSEAAANGQVCRGAERIWLARVRQ